MFRASLVTALLALVVVQPALQVALVPAGAEITDQRLQGPAASLAEAEPVKHGGPAARSSTALLAALAAGAVVVPAMAVAMARALESGATAAMAWSYWSGDRGNLRILPLLSAPI